MKPLDYQRLANRVAIVTGGASGIGSMTASRLAAEGATVAIFDIDGDATSRKAEELDSLGLEVDVSNNAQVQAGIARVEQEVGPLDIFVNNAGNVGAEHLSRVAERVEMRRRETADGSARTPLDALIRVTDEEWRSLLTVHLDGTFYGTRAAASVMVTRRKGSIINMASVCGIHGCEGQPHYSAAKAGIIGFSRSVAKELISQGVRVNVIAPGFVETAESRPNLQTFREEVSDRIPAGRLADPSEIAAAIAFLASDDAAYFVGATLSPNGGLVTAV